MSRNDVALYSGMSSPRKREVEKAKEIEKTVEPRAELVLDEIAKEKAQLTNVESFVLGNDQSDEQVVRQLQRARDQYEFLNKFEKRMKVLLGIK